MGILENESNSQGKFYNANSLLKVIYADSVVLNFST